MSTATASAPALPMAFQSVEAFRDDVSLLRCEFGGRSSPYTFVITCPDGALMWGEQLPETTDHNGNPIALPKIVADKVVITHVNGAIEELICQDTVSAEGEESSSAARW
jgi:hypothetical protein